IERAGTVEKLARAEIARESEQLRSALLDSLTHEFRTPLTAVKASVTSLLSNTPIEMNNAKNYSQSSTRKATVSIALWERPQKWPSLTRTAYSLIFTLMPFVKPWTTQCNNQSRRCAIIQ